MPLNLGSSDDDAASASGGWCWKRLCCRITHSPDFPGSSGAFQSKNANPGVIYYSGLFYIPGGNVLIAKLSADGTRLLFSTLVGGSSDEAPSAIAVDGSGNA